MTGMGRRAAGTGLLALAFGAAGAEPARAQERELRGAVIGYVAAGVSRIGTADLDGRLAAGGYPAFGRAAAALSVGAYLILEGGVMLGGEWHGLIMGEEEHEGGEAGLGGGYGTLGIAYALEVSPRVRVYPRLGLGGGGMGVWIESAGGEVAFDDVLANPELHERPDSAGDGELSMSRGSVVVDVGAGAEFLPGGWGRGLVIGVRLGYLAAPSTPNWRLDGRPVTGGPAATIAGPYIRVVLGGGPRW